MFGFFDLPPPPLSEFYVLFGCKIEVFCNPPSLGADVIYGGPPVGEQIRVARALSTSTCGSHVALLKPYQHQPTCGSAGEQIRVAQKIIKESTATNILKCLHGTH